ncbi:MAG: hypothetical protein BWX96_03330 [Bacteroidetes bacterium ADurb.Bin145]|nr:MAG: hypothetical protein BWX96_03330 [Bacteroidetes bacterium ADurb.Bin145]
MDPSHDPDVMLPFDMTIPFIVFTDDGEVIGPVVVRDPFIVTPLDRRFIKSVFETIPIFPDPKVTPPISPSPATSSLRLGDVVPIPSL